MKREYILCAAICYDDGLYHIHQPFNISSGYVMCGRRHHNIINLHFILTGLATTVEKQGFLTSKDRFVTREEAATIAYNADQIEKPKKELFSEDIY